jgi:hypothetical protein
MGELYRKNYRSNPYTVEKQGKYLKRRFLLPKNLNMCTYASFGGARNVCGIMESISSICCNLLSFIFNSFGL